MHRIESMEAGSAQLEVMISGDSATAKQALRSCAAEYGIAISKDHPNVVIKHENPMFVVEAKDAQDHDLMKTLAPDSLIVRAYNRLREDGAAKRNSEIVRCSYWLRPWITRDLYRTETIEGVFTMRTGSDLDDLYFTYDPEVSPGSTRLKKGASPPGLTRGSKR